MLARIELANTAPIRTVQANGGRHGSGAEFGKMVAGTDRDKPEAAATPEYSADQIEDKDIAEQGEDETAATALPWDMASKKPVEIGAGPVDSETVDEAAGQNQAADGTDTKDQKLQVVGADRMATVKSAVLRDIDQGLGKDDVIGRVRVDGDSASDLPPLRQDAKDGDALRVARAIGASPDAENLRRLQPELRPVAETANFEVEVSLHAATEARSDPSNAAVPASQYAARPTPQIAHDVMRQIGSGLANRESDQIKITLKPEELGTVRLVISGGERPAITVYADHRETLDLLRRHSEILARELKDSGFAGAEMSFAGDGSAAQRQFGQDQTSPPLKDSDPMPARPEQPVQKATHQRATGSQIDIRI